MTTTPTEVVRIETEDASQHATCSIRLDEQTDTGSGGAPSTEPVVIYVSVYSRFSNLNKVLITILLALCGFVGTMSTTGVLAAVPEIVDTFNTTTTTVNISNALYLLFMGLSSCIWGPASEIFGRKKVSMPEISYRLLVTAAKKLCRCIYAA